MAASGNRKLPVLITGATGMLGQAVLETLSNQYCLFATASRPVEAGLPGNPAFLPFDLTERDFSPLTHFCSPDVVINCAALTDHAACNDNPDLAEALNATAVAQLAKAFPSAYLIQISTDAVFGACVVNAREEDVAEPQTVYGWTKRKSEELLLAGNSRYAIVRTTVVGLGGRRKTPSFAEWALRSLQQGTPTGLYTDVLFTPIAIWDFAGILSWCITHKPEGILHAGGGERLSRHAFGLLLAEHCRLPTDMIVATRFSDTQADTGKRLDQSLNSERFQKLLGRALPDGTQCALSIARRYRLFKTTQDIV